TISLYWIGTRSPAPSLERVASLSPDRPALVVAPFANLGEGPEAHLYTAGLTEELMTILPRFKEIKVFGPNLRCVHIRGEGLGRFAA
ncbi:hypothetical protein AB9E21_34905, partial [Rhizobium leguminosarum]